MRREWKHGFAICAFLCLVVPFPAGAAQIAFAPDGSYYVLTAPPSTHADPPEFYDLQVAKFHSDHRPDTHFGLAGVVRVATVTMPISSIAVTQFGRLWVTYVARGSEGGRPSFQGQLVQIGANGGVMKAFSTVPRATPADAWLGRLMTLHGLLYSFEPHRRPHETARMWRWDPREGFFEATELRTSTPLSYVVAATVARAPNGQESLLFYRHNRRYNRFEILGATLGDRVHLASLASWFPGAIGTHAVRYWRIDHDFDGRHRLVFAYDRSGNVGRNGPRGAPPEEDPKASMTAVAFDQDHALEVLEPFVVDGLHFDSLLRPQDVSLYHLGTPFLGPTDSLTFSGIAPSETYGDPFVFGHYELPRGSPAHGLQLLQGDCGDVLHALGLRNEH